MLDDLVVIHEKDAQDALGVAEKQWQQLEYTFELEKLNFKPENIVFSGMGGSALSAQLALVWPIINVPFKISRNYDAPNFVSEKTLFIASSYSGNTEETLESLMQAERKGAFVVVISAGGKLTDIAKQKNYPLLVLPKVLQPRYSILYSFKALMKIFESCGLVDNEQIGLLPSLASFLKESVVSWRPDAPTMQNYAKQLALDILGKSIVVYGGPKTYSAAYFWKISFNENSKNVAWAGEYPEFNHNEFMGWTGHPLEKPYAVIDLRSKLENLRIIKRFELSARLLSGRRPAPIIVEAKGNNDLEQMLWLVSLGEFVSLYLAILNGINPTPIDLIEKFKKELN